MGGRSKIRLTKEPQTGNFVVEFFEEIKFEPKRCQRYLKLATTTTAKLRSESAAFWERSGGPQADKRASVE